MSKFRFRFRKKSVVSKQNSFQKNWQNIDFNNWHTHSLSYYACPILLCMASYTCPISLCMSHDDDVFGVTFNVIVRSTVFYTSTSRFVSWLGVFPQDRQVLWLPLTQDDLQGDVCVPGTIFYMFTDFFTEQFFTFSRFLLIFIFLLSQCLLSVLGEIVQSEPQIHSKLEHNTFLPLVVENHPLDGLDQLFHDRTSEHMKSFTLWYGHPSWHILVISWSDW